MTQQQAVPTRRELLTAFQGGESPGEPELPSWPWIEVADRCTLCAACVDACPTAAITKFMERGLAGLQFTPGKCDSCRACLSSCVHAAITLSEDQMTVPFKPRDVLVKEVGRCKTCQAPTTSGTQCEWCIGNKVSDGLGDIIAYAKAQRRPRGQRRTGPSNQS